MSTDRTASSTASAWLFMAPIEEPIAPTSKVISTQTRIPRPSQPGFERGIEERGLMQRDVGTSAILTWGGGYSPAMSHPHRHETHPALIKRLRRARGHLDSVIDMIEQGRECLDIAQQLQAVEKAISQAKKTLVQDHIDHCLEHAIAGVKGAAPTAASLEEFKKITRYL
jgi:uncharacterized protein